MVEQWPQSSNGLSCHSTLLTTQPAATILHRLPHCPPKAGLDIVGPFLRAISTMDAEKQVGHIFSPAAAGLEKMNMDRYQLLFPMKLDFMYP